MRWLRVVYFVDLQAALIVIMYKQIGDQWPTRKRPARKQNICLIWLMCKYTNISQVSIRAERMNYSYERHGYLHVWARTRDKELRHKRRLKH